MAGAYPATLEVLKASHMARIEVASRARTDWPVQSLNPDFKDLNIFHARGKGSDATRVATRLVPGSLQYARDLTVTALLGKPPNLALTLPLPSTSSENLQTGQEGHGLSVDWEPRAGARVCTWVAGLVFQGHRGH